MTKQPYLQAFVNPHFTNFHTESDPGTQAQEWSADFFPVRAYGTGSGQAKKMTTLTATHHNFLLNRPRRTFADVLNHSKQPFDAVVDFFIHGGRQRPLQHSEERIPLVEHPHGTKRSRQALGVATRLTMEHHGWKQTGTTSPLWAFEHRWAHRRDRAEGRNHRLPSK